MDGPRYAVGQTPDRFSPQAQEAIRQAVSEATGDADVVVPPESIAGYTYSGTRSFWETTSKGLGDKTVLLGANVWRKDRPYYENALVLLRDGEPRGALRARYPIPLSMWRPWSASTETPSAVAHPLDDGVATIEGKRVGYLICYEQVLVSPVIPILARDPDLLIASSNGWWAHHGRTMPNGWAKATSRPFNGTLPEPGHACSVCPWCLPLTASC